MIKIIGRLIFLGSLMLSVSTRAGSDNLIMTKYMQPTEVPEAFLKLGGGSAMTNKTYKDDDNEQRLDKVYYTSTHSYHSSYPVQDVNKMLNPSDNRLATLFEDTSFESNGQAGGL